MTYHEFSYHRLQIAVSKLLMLWEPKEILEEMKRLDEDSAEMLRSITT